MNKYVCFNSAKPMLGKIYIKAETTYEAQQKAIPALRAKKPWDVVVLLVEKDGVEVKMNTRDL